jgi:cytosine/adenosine deaminase-related metal-dependent hydrolase
MIADRRYTSRMILRARTVVTMDAAPIENGAVAISENRIADVGKFDEIKAGNAGQIVDLGEQALLPGLINAHCHLDYTCLRGKIPPQQSFADWIRAINAEKSRLSAQHYLASINEGFAEATRFGTTTIANLTAFPDLAAQIEAPIRTWWFAEMIDVRAPESAKEIVDLAIELLGRTRPPGAPLGLAPHALYTASKDLYRSCDEISRRENTLLTTHLAESHEEMEMFRDASGPLYEFMKIIGRPMQDCGNETPLELFLGAPGGRALPRWIVAHLNELAETDFELLEKSHARFHVMHCPRSHDYFGHTRFAFERLRSLGLNICLGTDSLASNHSLSLFDEMRAFQKKFPGTSPEEILQMVTVNSARALRQENAVGRIRPGFLADLIAIPIGAGNVFDGIIGFKDPVDWTLLDGKEQRKTAEPATILP